MIFKKFEFESRLNELEIPGDTGGITGDTGGVNDGEDNDDGLGDLNQGPTIEDGDNNNNGGGTNTGGNTGGGNNNGGNSGGGNNNGGNVGTGKPKEEPTKPIRPEPVTGPVGF